MIIKSTRPATPFQPPRRQSGITRLAAIDVEWTKNYHIKNGQRPFCYSIVWLDLPSSGTADLTAVPFEWTSVYVEEPDEMDALVRHAANTVATAADSADIITGHQFCADLSVLEATAPHDAITPLQKAREQWRQRRKADPTTSHYLDTRYDAGHLLAGASRRLVDVCTELGLDVTQPELRTVSMPAWHRRWIEDSHAEGRERVSVLNLRHSVSTAYVAARTADLGQWPAAGLNVNRVLADGAQGAWAWLTNPTFTALLEDTTCPSANAGLSPSKAPRRQAKPPSSTH
ncbi:hypothetical protein [Streptomyces sp. 769]|uniref:hypothetical protein n=1 Tax=Streptomyces sp. 769 TaxID=1262452 RepID=UPI00057D411C|nr:hypothetical protein [Streptomyces sp. 769]AJC58586.1 hypothetical protein GZL_06013 [Streptomyces sp. 769]